VDAEVVHIYDGLTLDFMYEVTYKLSEFLGVVAAIDDLVMN
jgi:hypothetical protein